MRVDNRYRILPDGSTEIIDPRWEDLPLLLELNPSFTIRTKPLPGFETPRFLKARITGTGIALEDLPRVQNDALWSRHDQVLNECIRKTTDEASLLDLKIELAKRSAKCCNLCARNCSVNRLEGEVGWCGRHTVMDEAFTHIAEEPEITPSFTLPIRNCGLRCTHCQMHSHSGNNSIASTSWRKVDQRARSIQVWNLEAAATDIFTWLRSAPDSLDKPIVLNTHGYLTSTFIRLFDHITDAWLPDFKFGNSECGADIAGVSDYPTVALASIEQMLAQKVLVICRILVLPGHGSCCHIPSLERLSAVGTDVLAISVMDQYCPDFRVGPEDGSLARRPTLEEVETVVNHARSLGLKIVE